VRVQGHIAPFLLLVSCGARSEVDLFGTAGPDSEIRPDASAVPPQGGHACVLLSSNVDAGTHATWLWNGATWTEPAALSSAPSGRMRAAAATLNGKVVVFGGETATAYVNETWVWDGATWSQKLPAYPTPQPRESASLATLNGKVLMFGGESPVGVYGDTWEWDGTSWTEQNLVEAPGARAGAAVAPLNGKIVLFGGFDGARDTWEWDGTTWTQRRTETSPAARNNATASTVGDVVVLFGGQVFEPMGYQYLDDTWEWDGSAWIQLLPTTSPPARGYAAAGAFEGAMVMAGGLSNEPMSSLLTDVWVWNGTWTERFAKGPSAVDLEQAAMSCY
jgi:N-acetylneuraminic acid mutarotase